MNIFLAIILFLVGIVVGAIGLFYLVLFNLPSITKWFFESLTGNGPQN